jgi:hypothetical protein
MPSTVLNSLSAKVNASVLPGRLLSGSRYGIRLKIKKSENRQRPIILMALPGLYFLLAVALIAVHLNMVIIPQLK